MKKRVLSVFLVLALVLSLCMVSAVAGEEPEENRQTAEVTEGDPATVEGTLDGENKEEEVPPVYLAGPDKEPEADPETGALLEEVPIVPDEAGTVTFANLERRLREGNLQKLLSCEERW